MEKKYKSIIRWCPTFLLDSYNTFWMANTINEHINNKISYKLSYPYIL